MPEYQNGKIYKVWDNSYTKCYVGSTTESLAQRMSKHRCYYKQWLVGSKKKLMVYELFNEFGVINCKIELIENYPCQSKAELEAREGHHIRNLDSINKRIEGRTKKEYRESIKEKMKEYSSEYRETNKELIREQRKQYRQENKEKIANAKKEYGEKSKEEIAKKKKERYEQNKGSINAKRRDNYAKKQILSKTL